MRKLECILLPRRGERGVEESLATGIARETACGDLRQYLPPRTMTRGTGGERRRT